MSELERWAEQSPENRRLYEQEGFILAVTEEIWSAMARRDVTQQQLADKLGTGKSHVSQLLNGARNMTLRTLSDVALALDQKIRVSLENAEHTQWTTNPTNLQSGAISVLRPYYTIAANDAIEGSAVFEVRRNA